MPGNDLSDWATQPRDRAQHCATCALPQICTLVEQYLTMRMDGSTNRTVSELHRYLIANHDYTLSGAALGKHIRNCRRELWQKIHHKT